jgi:hypothetical protein
MLDAIDTLIAFITIMLVVSMLITVGVQIVSAVFNLRGQNLARGLLQTANVIVPGFEAETKRLVDQILCGPLLSDSSVRRIKWFKRRASAVRPDEIFDALHRLAAGRAPVKKIGDEACRQLRDDAARLLKGLGLTDEDLAHAAAQVLKTTGVQQLTSTTQQLKQTADAVIGQLPAEQQTTIKAAIAALSDKLNDYETAAAQKVQKSAAAVEDAVEAAYTKFKYWFEVGQERAQQWFTTHTRVWTIILAIFFAFWCELDTIQIFKDVSTNRALRDSLVAQSVNVTKQAEKILENNPTVLQKALDAWKAGLTDAKAKTAIESAPIEVSPTETRESFVQKVKGALEKGGVTSSADLLSNLGKTIAKTVESSVEESTKQLKDVKLDLDQTGFALIPLDGKGRWGDTWGVDFCKHFWGMVFSAALLSLGAPFWFNALKSLASLRTKVAENISGEQEGEKVPPGDTPPAGPAAAKAPTAPAKRRLAPPTVLP